MITCKEDLIGTFIENDNGELRDFYISLCESFLIDGTPRDLGVGNEEWLGLNRECKFIGVYEGGMWIAHKYRSKEKQLTLECLKPQTKEVEWANGLPPVGVECEAVFIEHEHKGYGEFLILGYHSNYVWMEYIGELGNKSKHYTAKIDMVKFRKPETEAERKEREELEELSDFACESLFGESIQNCRKDVADTVRCMIEAGYRNDKVTNKKSTLY